MNKIIELILTYFEAKKTQWVRESSNKLYNNNNSVSHRREDVYHRGMTIQVLYVRIE